MRKLLVLSLYVAFFFLIYSCCDKKEIEDVKPMCCADTIFVYKAGTVISLDSATFTRVQVPNVFTPNGDGYNEAFGMQGLGVKNPIDFKISDVNGVMLWQTTSIYDKWLGSKDNTGPVVADDVYYYTLKFYNYNGDLVEHSGELCLRTMKTVESSCSNCVYGDQLDALLGLTYKTADPLKCD